jgi:hypothetical protein
VDIREKKLIQSLLASSKTGAKMGIPGAWEGTPLPPQHVNALSGAGSTKMPRKILSPNGLEVKILISKNLRVSHADCTAPLSPRL